MYIYKNGCLQKNMIIACTTTVSYSYLLSGKILHISILVIGDEQMVKGNDPNVIIFSTNQHYTIYTTLC